MGILMIAVLIIVLLVGLSVVMKDKKNAKKAEQAIEIADDVVAVDKNEQRDITNVTEFLLKNSLGNEIVFKRSRTEDSKEREYRAVSFSQVNQISGVAVSSAMPVLQQVVTAEKIAKLAPNGLFTTSASIDKLSKFADGSYSTTVRDASKNLIGHEGFTKVTDTVKGNPLGTISAGIQVLSLVSGQYYLHEINAQLENISKNLNKLIDMHHDEKIGI